jgi:uncharacterized membrane protein HdeD (DUF308 family)
MESIIDRAAKETDAQLTKLRWGLGIHGLLAILFGVVILIWPGISLYTLVILFGAYSLVSGCVEVVAAFSGPSGKQRGWLAVSGLLGIVVGVIVLVWTNMSALALLYVVGAYAIAFGIIAIGGMFWLPVHGADAALLFFAGVVSILFGLIMFAKPGDGALVLLALIAAFALVMGLAELTVAIGGKRLIQRDLERMLPAEPQASST